MGYLPWISVIGLYNYDPHIYDSIALPDGVDKDTFVHELLREAGELALVYHDPDLLTALFPSWSRAKNYKWRTLQNTTTLDYNPIENYNRTETWTEKRNGNSNEAHSGNDKTVNTDTNSGEDSGTTSAEGFTDVAAFNSSELVPQESTRTTGESTTKYGRVLTTNNTMTHGHQIATTDSDNSTHEGHISGNIGVTTSQQMIEQERSVADFNIYKTIINDFITEFCVMVY